MRDVRTAGWATTTVAAATGLVLVAGLATAARRSGPEPRRAAAPAAGASATPAPAPPVSSPDPDPDPGRGTVAGPAAAASPSPEPAGPSAPARPATPSPRPAPTAGGGVWTGPRRDGRPGWSTGFTGCVPARLPARSRPPAPGLRLEVHPLSAEVRPGGEVFAIAVVTNTTDEPVAVRLQRTAAATVTLVDGAGRARSAHFFSDGHMPGPLTLGPGEAQAFDVWAAVFGCADVPEDPAPPVPPGDYTLVVASSWIGSEPYRHGTWVSRGTPVRVADDAAEPPCVHDGTGCRQPPGFVAADDCSESEWHTGGDFGAAHDLALRVELDAETVEAGQELAGVVHVVNNGPEPRWIALDEPAGDGVLRSTGGPLGPGPGPAGHGESVTGARRPTWSSVAPRPRRIAPGESIETGIRIRSARCDDSPLPAGDYHVRTGVYVDHYGWWPAPDVRVAVTGRPAVR